MRPWLASTGGLKHRPEKAIKGCDYRGEVVKLGPPRTPHECCPLDLLLRIVCEFASQSEWTFARDLDVPARKRRRDCEPHRLAVESSGVGQPMYIEEVLHPAVCQREPH